MSASLRLGLLLAALILIIIIFKVLKDGKMSVKYSILWFICVFVLILLAAFPDFFWNISKIFGFQAMSNMVIGILILILLFITISLTMMIATQKRKTTMLIQEVSLLKEKIKTIEKK